MLASDMSNAGAETAPSPTGAQLLAIQVQVYRQELAGAEARLSEREAELASMAAALQAARNTIATREADNLETRRREEDAQATVVRLTERLTTLQIRLRHSELKHRKLMARSTERRRPDEEPPEQTPPVALAPRTASVSPTPAALHRRGSSVARAEPAAAALPHFSGLAPGGPWGGSGGGSIAHHAGLTRSLPALHRATSIPLVPASDVGRLAPPIRQGAPPTRLAPGAIVVAGTAAAGSPERPALPARPLRESEIDRMVESFEWGADGAESSMHASSRREEACVRACMPPLSERERRADAVALAGAFGARGAYDPMRPLKCVLPAT